MFSQINRFCGLFRRLWWGHHRHPRQSAHNEGLTAFLFEREERSPPSLHAHLIDMTFPSSQRILFSVGVPLECCIRPGNAGNNPQRPWHAWGGQGCPRKDENEESKVTHPGASPWLGSKEQLFQTPLCLSHPTSAQRCPSLLVSLASTNCFCSSQALEPCRAGH